MRKLLFSLVAIAMGAVAFAAGTPASATPAGAVTSLSDLVAAKSENVHWRRYGHRHRWYRRRYRHCWWSRRYGYRCSYR